MQLSRLLSFALPLLGSVATAQDPEHYVISVGDDVDGDGPTHLAWTPDGSSLVVLNARSRNVVFLDGATLSTNGVAPVGKGASDLEVTPDGRYALVSNSLDRTLSVLDVPTRSVAAVIPLSRPVPYAIEVASDSSFAVVASYGGAVSWVSVVDLTLLQEVYSFAVPGQAPYNNEDVGIELAPDDRTLLVPLIGARLLVGYDVTTGAKVGQFDPGNPFYVPVLSRADPTGTRVAVLYSDLDPMYGHFEIYVLDLATWTATAAGLWANDWGGPTERSLVLAQDGAQALVVGHYGLHFVDLATATTVSLWGVGGDALALTSDGSIAVVTSEHPAGVRTVDVATKTATGEILRSHPTRALAAHPLDQSVAALESMDDEDVALIDAAGGRLTLLGRAPTGPGIEGDGPTAIALDPTGAFAVTANERSDNLTLLDLRQRRATAWIPVHERPMDVQLFDAGRTAVVWHADGDLSVVDLTSQTVLTRFPTSARGARHPWWNPQPERLVPFDGNRILLYGAPDAVVVEVNGAATRVLASLTVPFGSFPEQAPSVSGAGKVGFPRSHWNEVYVVEAATLTPVYRLGTVVAPDLAVANVEGYMYVSGGLQMQRFQVLGLPKDMGTVDIWRMGQIRIDEAAGFAYLRSGTAGSTPWRLTVVDVAAMQVVAKFDTPELPVDLELAPPHVFVVLRGGTLLRFRADGPNTQLLSSHPTRGEPIEMVVAPDGRTVLIVQRDRDKVDVFEF